MTKSKIFLYFCLSFIVGIFLSSLFLISRPLMLGVLISGIIFISALGKHKKSLVFGFCLLFLVLGIWRQNNALPAGRQELIKYNDSGEEINLIGIVIKEPDIRDTSVKLTIGGRTAAKVLVTTNRYPEYKYGDELKITGKLKTPPVFEDFNYKNYLEKDGIYSVIEWPKIEIIKENQGSILYKCLFTLKNKLKESLNQFLSPPQSGLLEALFFGDEENISQDWKDKFNLTGTRHITAVSGMNITIISALLLNFLLFIGHWRGRAFYFSLVLIVLYILMIGAPASAVRAGIMGCFFLTAQHFGRLSAASRAIVLASAIMLFFNPLLLTLDVGFQLSFLAMMGLIYFQPFFLNFFKKIPNIFQIKYTLSATLSAQIFTLPILIYNFGRFSLTSPLTNILIVPILPIITILGFIFSFFGIIFPVLGWILSWPAWLFLTYILKVIDFFSKIPFTSIILRSVHWLWLLISYLILAILAYRLKRRETLKFLNY